MFYNFLIKKTLPPDPKPLSSYLIPNPSPPTPTSHPPVSPDPIPPSLSPTLPEAGQDFDSSTELVRGAVLWPGSSEPGVAQVPPVRLSLGKNSQNKTHPQRTTLQFKSNY